jgi:hypothetical protein
MIGLDSAGKTTVLYKLKLGELSTILPLVQRGDGEVQERQVNFSFPSLLVLCNKQDLPNAMPVAEVSDELLREFFVKPRARGRLKTSY